MNNKNVTLLINPINIVHDRAVDVFRKSLPDWNIRCIYNPKFPWFSDKKKEDSDNAIYFKNSYLPRNCLKDVAGVILFTAQPRVPPCSLIQEAAFRSIPVIVVEETYQIALEQGFVNNYLLPVDHLLAASDYEREGFLKVGIPADVVETTGYVMRSREPISHDPALKDRLRKELGVSGNKRVAVLSLRYVTPHGETPEIRNKILEYVYKNLPGDYALVVKPHPGEEDKGIHKIIKELAPSAKVVEPREKIDRVLEVADVLFDRGNSQVIIDALQKGVPVAIIPMGKKTMFHGLLDEVIINRCDNISSVLKIIEKKGLTLYKEIIDKYIPGTPEGSLRQTMDRVAEIAKSRKLYKPALRLAELSLFWAWMGYVPQALVALNKIRHDSSLPEHIITSIRRLISQKADRDDLSVLKEWGAYGYRQWLIQSLWIKFLYMTGKKAIAEDTEWLAEYPPPVNRSHFLTYVDLLYRCYAKSGFDREKNTLANMFCEERDFAKNIEKRDWNTRFNYLARLYLKNLTWGNANFTR